jgi:hypothetical protein
MSFEIADDSVQEGLDFPLVSREALLSDATLATSDLGSGYS